VLNFAVFSSLYIAEPQINTPTPTPMTKTPSKYMEIAKLAETTFPDRGKRKITKPIARQTQPAVKYTFEDSNAMPSFVCLRLPV
jgi:hypothetical protein